MLKSSLHCLHRLVRPYTALLKRFAAYVLNSEGSFLQYLMMYQETGEAITPPRAQRNRPDAPQMCFYIEITNIESNDFTLIRLETDITDKSLAQFTLHLLHVT